MTALRHVPRRLGSAWRQWFIPAPFLRSTWLEDASRAVRPRCTAEALLVFTLGFAVDDLHALRFPAWLVGAIVAFLLLTGGPLWHGRRLLLRLIRQGHGDAIPEALAHSIDVTRRRGLLGLAGAALLFAVFLVFFTEGVPPWAM